MTYKTKTIKAKTSRINLLFCSS